MSAEPVTTDSDETPADPPPTSPAVIPWVELTVHRFEGGDVTIQDDTDPDA